MQCGERSLAKQVEIAQSLVCTQGYIQRTCHSLQQSKKRFLLLLEQANGQKSNMKRLKGEVGW
jgi:hypothetical protein